jgi:hypothetical protein
LGCETNILGHNLRNYNVKMDMFNNCSYIFWHIHGKLIMTLEKELVEPSSGGSFDRFSFNVRLKPSLGGSRICTSTPYAAFIAYIAPTGSPPKKMASGGGVGNDIDSSKTCEFFIDTYKLY